MQHSYTNANYTILASASFTNTEIKKFLRFLIIWQQKLVTIIVLLCFNNKLDHSSVVLRDLLAYLSCSWLLFGKIENVAFEVNRGLLKELEDMGFSMARAAWSLHHSGMYKLLQSILRFMSCISISITHLFGFCIHLQVTLALKQL